MKQGESIHVLVIASGVICGADMLNFNSALFLETIYHGNLKLGTMVVCDEGFPKMYIF